MIHEECMRVPVIPDTSALADWSGIQAPLADWPSSSRQNKSILDYRLRGNDRLIIKLVWQKKIYNITLIVFVN